MKIHEITQTPSVDAEVLRLAKRAQELANQRAGGTANSLAWQLGSLRAVTGMLVRLLEAPEKTVNDVAYEHLQELHAWEDQHTSDSDRAGIPERGEI